MDNTKKENLNKTGVPPSNKDYSGLADFYYDMFGDEPSQDLKKAVKEAKTKDKIKGR